MNGDTVLEKIEELLSAPARGVGAPTRERVETTLTDGYAQALALEAERLRLEQRLGEVARTVDGSDPAGSAQEFAALARSLTSAEGELDRLRALLVPLRERARTARDDA